MPYLAAMSVRLAKFLFAAVLLASQHGHAQDAPARIPAVPVLPASPYIYGEPLPGHLAGLGALDSTPEHNKLTNAGATLGRVLFFDRQLSRNGLVACASCHTQAVGFDDPTRFSIGFAGRITRRSAMTLTNARFNPQGRYFRDQRALALEAQVLEPFADLVEMGLERGELVARVSSRRFYQPLFEAAFGNREVSEARIAKALAQYVRAIVSYRSKYDTARQKALSPLEDFAAFSAAENRGKALFMTPREQGGAGCANCHAGEAFVLLEPKNNGLEAGPSAADDGLGEITLKEADRGRFRAPSLRNIAVTMPYMHDGRFASLEQVIEHYASGVKAHRNLSAELRGQNNAPARLQLDRDDRKALIAFLGTLTDHALNSDPRFADPFLVKANPQ